MEVKDCASKKTHVDFATDICTVHIISSTILFFRILPSRPSQTSHQNIWLSLLLINENRLTSVAASTYLRRRLGQERTHIPSTTMVMTMYGLYVFLSICNLFLTLFFCRSPSSKMFVPFVWGLCAASVAVIYVQDCRMCHSRSKEKRQNNESCL
jgi:Na+/melibiose symporter-like transporter